MNKPICKAKALLFPILILSLVLASCTEKATPPSSAASPTPSAPSSPLTRIQLLGHSSFLVTSSDGTRIITDPYAVSSSISYAPITETADIVTVSHEHSDHNNVVAVKGTPEVVRSTKIVKGIEFKGIATFHDDAQGTKRGNNTVICFTVDGVRFCHLGDLGHRLSPEQIAEIGKVDILFIPVGGLFTIDAEMAIQICNDLKPRVAIPMHFKTLKVGFALAGVEDFLKGKQSVRRLNSSVFEFRSGELPSATEIVVLDSAK